MTTTGSEGTAWSCVRGGAAGGQGKGLHQGLVGAQNRLVRVTAPSARVQGVFGQCSQTQDWDFGWCCVEPGVGLSDPCGSLPTQRYYTNSIISLPVLHAGCMHGCQVNYTSAWIWMNHSFPCTTFNRTKFPGLINFMTLNSSVSRTKRTEKTGQREGQVTVKTAVNRN